MEEETVIQYVREFSEIEGLQHAAQIHYSLCRQPCGLQLSVGAAGCGVVGLTEEFAAGLLKFLYENAVAPENLCGVVQDLCGGLASCQGCT